MAAAAHLRPDLFARLPKLAQEGRLDDAREIFYCRLPVIYCVFKEPDPAPVKAALAMMGKMRDELRSPMQTASAELREGLKDIIRRLEN